MKPTSISTIAIAAFTVSSIAYAAQAADKPTPSTPAQDTTALSDRATAMQGPATAPQTRNWAKADTDGDHLISPDEMEVYLQANPGPLNPARSASK